MYLANISSRYQVWFTHTPGKFPTSSESHVQISFSKVDTPTPWIFQLLQIVSSSYTICVSLMRLHIEPVVRLIEVWHTACIRRWGPTKSSISLTAFFVFTMFNFIHHTNRKWDSTKTSLAQPIGNIFNTVWPFPPPSFFVFGHNAWCLKVVQYVLYTHLARK